MKTQVKNRPYLIPSFYQLLQDEAVQYSTFSPVELENHFNDVYKLYLRRLSDFEMMTGTDSKVENELTSILSELIRVKHLLEVV